MGYQISLLVLLAFVALATAQSSSATPKNFQIRVESRKSDKDQDLSPATLQQIRARQLAQQQQQQPSSEFYSEEEEDDENVPVQTFHRPASSPQRQYQPQPQQHHSQQPQQRSKTPLSKKQREQFEQELEEEEPDHLALLLEKSSFTCNGRTTGYYADDSVECQVFHYCQDNTKHSWICPEGAVFHQVHLICMPPSDENICQQSQKYHFVNDYLYKPINMEEFQSKPNVSLRYHERYYPENIYNDDRSEYDEEERAVPVRHQPKPVVRTQSAYRQQQQQPQQQQQQNAYRSPDEINISLQQRRPYFASTTQRYEEDDERYNYEK